MITSWLECCDLASDSRSVVSDSLQPHGLYTPWNSPGENAGVGSFSVLQGIFPTQGLNPGLPHCRKILYQLSYKGPRQCVKKQRRYFANKAPYSQGYGLSSSYVRLWEMNRNGRALKNWCFWTVVLVKTLESPLDSKEIKPVILKGNQLCILTERTDAEAETPVVWPPNGNSWLIGKVLDAGKDWRQKRATENEMVGWDRVMLWTWIWANSGKWDREAWLAAVCGVTKSLTQLSD